jgi:LPXTG-motif cell wall-anchored protein
VDENCVPGPGEDANCNPIDENCVPAPGEDENCVAGVDEEREPPVRNRPEVNLPPMVPDMVAGVEAERAPQVARAGVVSGVLPQTGAGDLLGLVGFAGLVMMLAGGTAIAFQRRMKLARVNE